jgi:peptidoglycan/LPS O-acetylase OafA/YrhL
MDRFRGDVEGLRALAIGIVLLAHAGVGAAAGGYVGVDVFFLISGFLITRLLVGERERTGRISFARFYARRIKRLLPQALTATAVVALAAPLLLSPLAAFGTLDDVTAASAYAMNWHLAAASVDYFATGAADGPLDHFWSLAVEEQFYLAWPLLLLIVRPRRLAPALAVIAVASLAYAVQRVAVAPDQAYFSTATRAWELALGGLLAVTLADRRLGRRTSAALAWGGLAAIAVAAVTFGAHTAVPALPALLPTLGAAALVAAGACATPSLPTRALSLRPVRFVGRISYAWYVWHWPVLVFAAAAWGPLSTAAGLAVTVASLVPTLITHRWIEEPIRRSRLAWPRLTLATAPVAAGVVLATATVVSWSVPAQTTLAAGEAEGAAQLGRTSAIQRSATALRPSPRDADDDRGRSYRDGCLVGATALHSPPCIYGARSASATVVLFGDSHAMQWFPALERIVELRRWRLVELTKAGCPPEAVSVVYAPLRRAYPECDEWRRGAMDRIARERPALVVVAASVQYRVVAGGHRLDAERSTRALEAGYAPILARLRQAARRVTVIADVPLPPWDVPDCVAREMDDLRRCAFPRAAAVARSARIAAAIPRMPGVDVVDPADAFCLAALCPAVIGDVLVYRRTGHMTASYAATLASWLDGRLP